MVHMHCPAPPINCLLDFPNLYLMEIIRSCCRRTKEVQIHLSPARATACCTCTDLSQLPQCRCLLSHRDPGVRVKRIIDFAPWNYWHLFYGAD
uniref:Uncharacterized protein n=1 Tax=Arundo donax TaxID=35708 RepID=A0A0A9D558_ARUDO